MGKRSFRVIRVALVLVSSGVFMETVKLLRYKMLGESDQPETAAIPNLHEDELVSILQWLPAKQLIQLESVSPEWKDLVIPRLFAKVKRICLNDFIKESTKWRNPSAGDDNICGLDIFKKLLSLMGSQLTSLSLNCADSQLGPEELHLLATECPKLTHLDLTKVTVDPSALCQLGLELKLLESLEIKNIRICRNYYWPTLYRAFGIAVASMTNLKHLAINNSMGRDFLPLLPSTVTSIDIEADLDQTATKEFLQNHLTLEQLRLKSSNLANDMPTWLAQYCPKLTHLHLSSSGSDFRLTMSFADVFASLSHLKQFELGGGIVRSFTNEDLQDLCDNCPNLEVLVLSQLSFSGDRLTRANAMAIGRLQNLKRLEWPLLMVSHKSIVAICEGVGAAVEFLQLQSNALNDTSLRAISRHCPNLTYLHLSYNNFTQAGMTSFIQEITSHPSWSDPKRNLRIELNGSHVANDSDTCGGRVKLIKR